MYIYVLLPSINLLIIIFSELDKYINPLLSLTKMLVNSLVLSYIEYCSTSLLINLPLSSIYPLN